MGPAIALFVQTAIFWIRHRNIDEDVYMTYDDDEIDATTVYPLKGDASSEKVDALPVVPEKETAI